MDVINNKCFVIQPFDKGPHDSRYQDILAPAIQKCGLIPYRVDEDFTASILIKAIETNIRNSRICLADISANNPNVWYELGYAYASGKNVVLICKKTETLPFDIRHKKVILYSTESMSDFDILKENIVKRITSILSEKDNYIDSFSKENNKLNENVFPTIDMKLIISLIFDNTGDRHEIFLDDLKILLKTKLNCSNSKVKFIINDLTRENLIEEIEKEDHFGNLYNIWRLSEKAINWCNSNRDEVIKLAANNKEAFSEFDIPF